MESSQTHTHDHANWRDDEFAKQWIDGQAAREPERRSQFVKIRAVIPKTRTQEFSYVNIGAGAGHLDEILLDHFSGAQATLVDYSLAMLEGARKRLERFGDRVEYVQADLDSSDWAAAVGGPFEVALSSMTFHHLRDGERVRQVYVETGRLLGHGGMLLNLDFVRPALPSLKDLSTWAAQDPEAGFTAPRAGGGADHAGGGTVSDHLNWLTQAGFSIVDVLWKDPSAALFCGVLDHLHLPTLLPSHEHDHGSGSHSHDDEHHDHSHSH